MTLSRSLRPALSALLAPSLLLLAGCGSGTTTPSPTPTPPPVQTSASASLNVAGLQFGALSVGTAAVPQLLQLTGTSGTTTFTGITITGANAASFSATSNCPATLATGASCLITVGFTPSSSGTQSAVLTVADNNTSTASQSATLSGTGVALAPAATFSAKSLVFAGQAVGAPASTQAVTVKNAGTASLSFSAITLAQAGSGFTLGGTCLVGTPLAPAASCTIAASFAATSMTQQTGTITVASNDAGSPATISLSGNTGLPFVASVLAGTQPVSGAQVRLLAAGTTGNGSAATVLSTATLTTDATGTVQIPGLYNCPTSAAQLYLVSSGGSVGTAGAANPGLVMMSAIGPCSQVTSGQKVVIDEATTVGSAFALAPFYSAGGQIGASATNVTGIANAFLSASELVSSSAGTAPGASLPANAASPSASIALNMASPVARINTLANIINNCAVKASNCAAIFQASAIGSATPTNTLDAIYNIAHAPANNVPALYTAATGGAYTPSLNAQPSDWTLFLTISGGGLQNSSPNSAGPSGLGIDSTGSVWVAAYFSDASKFTTLGVPVFPNGITGSGLNNSYGLSMDAKDNVWIPNEQPNNGATTGSVSEFNSLGTSLAGTVGFTLGGMDYPIATAVDPNGTTWVIDYGNSHLTLLNSAGVPLSGPTGYVSDQFAFPVAVAIDSNHFGWIANQASSMVTKVAPDGSSFVNYDCCNASSSIAIDQGNNVWITNYFGSSISLISANGAILSKGAYTANAGLDHPQGIAIDGAGNAWIANFRQPYLSAMTGVSSGAPGTSLTPKSGFGADAGLLEAYSIAVDASGNVWVSNFGSSTITKFIGLATPVKTPLTGLPQVP